jgi:hypothetical protein
MGDRPAARLLAAVLLSGSHACDDVPVEASDPATWTAPEYPRADEPFTGADPEHARRDLERLATAPQITRAKGNWAELNVR